MASLTNMAVREAAAMDKIKSVLRIERWNRDPRMRSVLELEQIAEALEAGAGKKAMKPVDMIKSGLASAKVEDIVDLLGISEASAKKLQAKAKE